MRTVPLKSILDWLARRMLGSEANLTTEFASAYVDMINTAVRVAWERDFWPEWTEIEERQYRPSYRSPLSGLISQGTEYLFQGAYYRALSNTLSDPLSSPSQWERFTPEAFIPLEQDGFPAIGTPMGIHREDPRRYCGASPVGCTLSRRGLEVHAPALATFWLTYRLRPPVFTTALFATAAVAGAVYYDAASGNCYQADADTTDAPGAGVDGWTLVPMPYVLAEAVKRAAYADALRDDGQNDKAEIETDNAEDLLAEEWTKQEGQVGVVRRFGVVVR